MSEIHVAVLVIGAIVLNEVVKLTVGRFFKRTVETEYRTVLDCRTCREECLRQRSQLAGATQGEMSDLGRSLDILRGILLVIAVKVGVDDDVLQNLAHGRRSNDR